MTCKIVSFGLPQIRITDEYMDANLNMMGPLCQPQRQRLFEIYNPNKVSIKQRIHDFFYGA